MEQQWKVSFLDKKRERTNIRIEITYRNKYKEFTVCSDTGQGKFEPANEPQQRLLDLWNEYHLNGTNPGTKKQSELVKGLNYNDALEKLCSIDRETGKENNFSHTELTTFIKKWNREIDILEKWYEDTKSSDKAYFDLKKAEYTKELSHFQEKIKSTMLYDIHPTTGELHKYGSGWIKVELPEDIEEQIEEIIDEITEAENERKGEPLKDLPIEKILEIISEETSFEGRDLELAAAFVLMFGLSQDDLQDIEIDGTECKVQGIDYLAGDNDEMDDAWDNDLENYIEECILPDLPETVKRYFDNEAWKRDARYDGRAHSLNRYDGNELEVKIGETYYYAYRQ
jgi:hypothetical protein